MNKICIKPRIPKGEDGFTLTSSESSVSVVISYFHSLPELSFATLLTAAGFLASSNDGQILCIFRWDSGTDIYRNYWVITLITKNMVIYLHVHA